jgi:hypothetical protein
MSTLLQYARTPVAWSLAAIALCASQIGCVERRLTIRSNPPGAVVYVDDYPIGTTPVATNFVYYGTRKIRLVKDGYETLTVLQPVPSPWYEVPPLDFFSENLWPHEVRDQRVLDYQLMPQAIVPPEQILSRGENLRRGSQGPPVGAAAAAGQSLGAPAQPLPPPAARQPLTPPSY